MLLHILDRLVENGQVPQPEKVHLEQAHLFDGRAFPLGNHIGLAGNGLQRDILRDRSIRNHHPCGMGSGTARQTFNLFGQIQHLADFGITVVKVLQLSTLFDRLVQRDVQRFGDHLGDEIHIFRRDRQHPCDIADRRLGFQCPERPDLRNVGRTIFLLGIVYDRLAAITTKIDIDIGRFGSAGIQESLEQQIVFQRTNVAQSQDVSDDGSTGGTSRTTRNSLLDGKPDKVPDDQKIAGVTHLLDDRQLEIHSFTMSGGDAVGSVTKNHPLVTKLTQVVDILLPFGGLKDGIVP